jgi:translation initiation factor IF-1
MPKETKTKDVKNSDTIVVEGVITELLPGLEYNVEIEYEGMKHDIVCYVSGKMRTHYIQLDKGDKVRVEISLYDIDRGRIVYRLTQKGRSLPPRK